jgi:hypothetical protein
VLDDRLDEDIRLSWAKSVFEDGGDWATAKALHQSRVAIVEGGEECVT